MTSVVATSTYGSSRKKVARSRTSTVLSTSVSPPHNALSGFAVAHAYSVGGRISTSMYSTAPQITTTGNSAWELSGLTPHVVTTDVTNSYRSQPQVICNNVLGQMTCETNIANIMHTPFVCSGVSNMMHVPQMISSVGDDIAVHVPQNIKQKIQKGEHIDLSILLSNNHHNVPAMQKLSIYQGELVTQLRSNQFKIVSVEQCTAAFIIFTSVYMHMVRLGAKHLAGLVWKIYDEVFRLRKALDPTSYGLLLIQNSGFYI